LVELGYLSTCLTVIGVLQCIKAAQWPDENAVLALPGMAQSSHPYSKMSISDLISIPRNKLDNRLSKEVRHLSIPN